MMMAMTTMTMTIEDVTDDEDDEDEDWNIYSNKKRNFQVPFFL
jgi:hypothetical protein